MISCQDAIFYLYEEGENMDISGPEMISSINFVKIEFESNIPILDAVKKWLATELVNKAVNPVSFFDHAILGGKRWPKRKLWSMWSHLR